MSRGGWRPDRAHRPAKSWRARRAPSGPVPVDRATPPAPEPNAYREETLGEFPTHAAELVRYLLGVRQKATPGEWEARRIGPEYRFTNGVLIRPRGEPDCGAWIADAGAENDEESVANGILLAAAPVLLFHLAEVLGMGPRSRPRLT